MRQKEEEKKDERGKRKTRTGAEEIGKEEEN